MPASCSVQRPSRSISRRCLAFILKWNWHLGQTKRFASRSLRKTIALQDSHLTHRPSVRTRRSSGGVVCSIDFLSRLNQAMEESCQFSVISFELSKITAPADVFAFSSLSLQHPASNSRSPAEPVYPW